ncbi:MAG: hypothetical protein ISS77_08740 [Phycisphaerae bacterium]|nr:hypothetical protein [Phycisphaerae bacterium]
MATEKSADTVVKMCFSQKVVFNKARKGSVFVISLIFILVFSALAVSITSLSGTSLQISNNQKKASSALDSAHSGFEILRYYLNNVGFSGAVDETERFAAIASNIEDQINSSAAYNMNFSYDSVNKIITFTDVTLNSQQNQNFTAVLSEVDSETVCLSIEGCCGEFSKNVEVNFVIAPIGNRVFDYGVATVGPLQMSGQAEIEGVNLAIEASVYILGDSVDSDSFSITNKASVAGEVSIANPYATYSVGTQSSVGGATGEDASDMVHIGVGYTDFPVPDPDFFRQFATGEVIDSTSDWDNYSVLNNVVIAAGTNPTFASNVTINGVLFIETPNTVHFAGQSVVNAIVVGDGDIDDESSSSNISFSGQVICNDVGVLEGSEFDDIKQNTGTFIMAPGFSLDFSGQENQMHGAIAASGISFSGQAGGTVNGTLINYSQDPMYMAGQSTLMFNRSGIETNPSGFRSDYILEYMPGSYAEPVI